MNLTYPSQPTQGATYSDFCSIVERLYCATLQEPARIEINSVDEYRVNGWFLAPSMMKELKQAALHIKAIVNPTTGAVIPFNLNEQVGLGIMRFLDATGEPLALLELYPVADEALMSTNNIIEKEKHVCQHAK